MMHGYLFSPFSGLGMHSFFGFGGWLIPMGIGLLVVVGVILWFAFANREQTRSHVVAYGGQHVAAPGSLAQPTPPVSAAAPADSAEAIVRERLARGEIDRDEYDRLIATLRR